MPDIDPTSVNYLLNKKTKFKFPLGCEIFEEVKSKLTKKENKKIMNDLGIYLSAIHKIKGVGAGLVDPRALDKEELIGNDKNWYDFWTDNFNEGFIAINNAPKIKLSNENRKLMIKILDKREEFLDIIKQNKKLMNSGSNKFLNGNVYTKNIILKNKKFVGLCDFSKVLIGDPVDEIAYFSVMPSSEKYLDWILETWRIRIDDKDFDKKMHLYRLIESYRKIITRYVKHKYLNDYPEPLKIAREEFAHYNISV